MSLPRRALAAKLVAACLLIPGVALALSGAGQDPQSPIVASRGSVAGDVVPPEAPAPEVAPNATRSLRWEGEFSAELMLPGPCRNELRPGCSGPFVEVHKPVFVMSYPEDHPDLAGASRFVLVAEWTPATPAANVIHVRVRDEATREVVALAHGASPLRIEMQLDALARNGRYEMDVSPDVAGAFVNQAVAVALGIE